MTGRTLTIWAVVVPSLLALLTVGLLSTAPGVVGLVGAGALLCWGAFTLWPWSVLPFGIIGGTITGGAIGGGDVRTLVVIHTLILAVGCVALLTRQILGLEDFHRSRTTVDVAMLVLTAFTTVMALYGLALGNLPMDVVVAAYQVTVIPVYFFLGTRTLNDRRRLRAAAILYITPAALLTAAALAAPGHHGGLIAMLAAPPLVVLAGRGRGWRRAGFALLAALFLADVVLSSFRALWLAAGITIVLMLLRGGRIVRQGMAATAAAALVFIALAMVDSGLRARVEVVAQEVDESPGYRAPESSVGLDVFANRPLAGGGLGQSAQDIYLAGFSVTDVGPVYHAFYVTLLANAGLVGLAVVLWPILRTLPDGFRRPNGVALVFAAMTCGFLVGAVFAGPTDGHWELGLLPALTLMALRAEAPVPGARAEVSA
ncbi:O-antigen ligase family protein [Micromonospora sp. NPDC050417]|uniref:O-antigen ligase family protein n=1 Tax=Micromonospora sp. NPDC050417 TaxID=3364280 RepID=UPI0037BCB5F4